MSNQPAVKPEPFFPIARSWRVATVVALIMTLLALLGVGLATASKEVAPVYWISLVPIFGVLCMGTAWARTRHSGGGGIAVTRQLLHWLGIGVALALEFLVRRSGEESSTAAGQNALLVLALGCYLAGVHLEWMFVIVGVLLTITLVIVSQAEQYVWLIFVIGGVCIVALFVLQRFFSSSRPVPAKV
jgi:hypothetical protein